MTTNAIAELIKERSGIVVPERKLDVIAAAIRANYPGLSLESAMERVRNGPGLPDWLISATTINETFFFRHPEQFKYIESWLGQRSSPGKIRALCLGCSTGEEPYSLAMTLNKVVGSGQFEITAVDLDPKALETAEAGQYPESSVQRTPAIYRDVLLSNVRTLKSGAMPRVEVSEAIRRSVRFVRGNIMRVPLAQYDFVLARNVLIYLTPGDRAKVLDRLRTHIPRDGVAIIGAGELPPQDERWEAEESTWCLRRAV